MYSILEQVIAWLDAHGYEAFSRPPEDAPDCPDEFVTVERVGGGVADLVDRPRIAVQTWAPTEDRAEEMGNELRMLMLVGARPRGVHSWSVDSGPYRFYDEETRCPRYQLTVDVASQLVD